MFGRRTLTALVVGAGPVGLFTALSLAKRGQSVRIIDRGVRTNFDSFALALHPTTLSLLEGCGILEPALALGLKIPRILFQGFDAAPWSLEFRDAGARFPHILILPQGPFEGLLVRALKEEGIEVEWNRSVTGLTVENDRVVAHIDHLAEQAGGYAISGFSRVRVGASRIHASHLVGTDGLWSTVRRELRIGWKRTGSIRHFAVFEFPVTDSRELRAQIIRNANGLHAVWPLPSNRLRMTFEEPSDSPDEVDLRELSINLERNGIAMDMPTELIWASRVSFEAGRAESFGGGRCWLAGDSAHRTLPHGVQSMNAGLVEAALLASRIGDQADGLVADATKVAEHHECGCLDEWIHLLGEDTSDQIERERRAVIPATGRLHRTLLARWHDAIHAIPGLPGNPQS